MSAYRSDSYDGYSIPDDQRIIDDFVDTAGPLLSNFVRDTNGDNIWDTAVVVVGIGLIWKVPIFLLEMILRARRRKSQWVNSGSSSIY